MGGASASEKAGTSPTKNEMRCDSDEIRNVLALYAHYFDWRDLDAWLGLFTDDVHREVLVGDETRQVLQGRNALAEYWRARRVWSKTNAVNGRHVVANVAIVDRNDTTAQVRAYVMVVAVPQAREPSISITGEYQGGLVKRHGRCRIKRWIIRLDREP